jgi:hypothetical protein
MYLWFHENWTEIQPLLQTVQVELINGRVI